MDKDRINLIIADDHDFYRDGLIQQFKQNTRFNVLDSCRDGEHLLRSISVREPDVVLIDLRMPVICGIEAIKQITMDYPKIRIIVMTIDESELTIEEALQAGALSYVSKNMPKDELFEAVESTYRNYPYYCNLIAGKLRRVINANRNATGSVITPNFTSAELMIIRLICKDMLVAEIAEEMLLGKRTIEKYRANIYQKISVRTTAGIAIYAIRNGLFHPED
jgi:DNA-binding NarL/FixJ family response regulator